MAMTKWALAHLETAQNAASVGNNAANLSSAVENGTSLAVYVDFHILANFSVAPTANSTIDLYTVEQDGTNYEDGSATGPILPANGYIGSLLLRNVTGDQRAKIRDYIGRAPARDFKVLVVNNATGQTATITVKCDFRNKATA